MRVAVVTTIEEVLSRVGVWRGREVTATELSGGLTNTTTWSRRARMRYVVRILGRPPSCLRSS